MSGERLTPEQVRASDPAASVWVAASAGTGKTHVLTARLLRLMLGGTPPERLLCLTFTKAAAAEMANRLRRTLGRWTYLEDRALDAAIYAACGIRADDRVRAEARRLFARVLDLGERLRIDTMHAFCQSLLSRFPLEAGLPPHFEVIEEDRAAELLAAARDHVLLRPPSEALSLIVREVGEEDFARLAAALIRERQRLAELVRVYGSTMGAAQAVRRALGLGADEDEATIIARACAETPVDRLARLAEVFAAHGGKKEQEASAPLAAFLGASASDRAALWPELASVFLTTAGAPRSTRGFPTKGVLAAWPDAFAIVKEEITRIAAVEERSRLLRAARFTGAALELGAAIWSAYEEEKRREGMLDYDDLIYRTEELLAQPGLAPWILYKLDAGIDHVLVDEAQDTNPEQWRIIEALTGEFFAGSGAREEPRTVFAVGDVKQSIYAFQRADPRAFIEARERIAARARAAGLECRSLPLDRSFRSTRAVLSLVDAVFSDTDAARGLAVDSDAIRHEAHRAEDGGLVELWPAEEPPEAVEREPWDLPLRQEPRDSAEARLAVRIALRIRRMLDERETLVSCNRPVRPGDIMVLVRRRTEFVPLLVKALKLLEVPVAGTDRMTVTGQLAVRDLLALAAFTLLPEDDLTLATVLKGPLVGMGEEELYALAYGREKRSLWAALTDDAGFSHVRDFLLACLGDGEQLAPFEFFSRILTERGGRRRLIARLGTEVIDPVDELLRLARDYERDHPPSLQAFLRWVERGGAEVKRDPEQGQQEVRILTVHGAKGLEAPIVFLPDCCSTPARGEPLLRLPLPPPARPGEPDLSLLVWRGNSKENEVGPLAAARAERDAERDEEYRRLLYVAMTRAGDRLYIAGWKTGRRDSARSWHEMIADGFDRLDGIETIEEADGRTVRRYSVPQLRDVEAPAATLAGGKPQIPEWLRRPPPPEPAPPKPLVPSRPDTTDPAVASPLAGSPDFRRGRLIHRLLELLPDLPQEERERAAQRFLARHGIDGTTARDWWKEVAGVLDDPVFSPLFAPGSLAEAAVAGMVGGHVLAGRIDRLAIDEETVFVVDYKTNRPPPPAIGAVPAAYLRQMAGYVAALGPICQGRRVRAALLWTYGPRLMELPPKLLAPHMPESISGA